MTEPEFNITKVKECSVSWEADHEQYFQGHGIAFTDNDACVTGCGSTLRESFEDALESLTQDDILLTDSQEAELLTDLRTQLGADHMLDTDIAQVCCDSLGDHIIPCATCDGSGKVYLEPEEDDLTSTDHLNWYQTGKLVLSISADVDYKDALQAFMDTNEFWPNCWFISDHGNAINVFSETGNVEGSCLDCDGTGIVSDDEPDCAVCSGDWHFYVHIDVKFEKR